MALVQRIDNRTDERVARFSGEFSCRLISNEDENLTVAIRPIDVSRRGLGFFTRETVRNGGFFWLVIGTEKFRVELAYCNTHLGIDNLFRCGLFLREADGNLYEACDRAGLLKSVGVPGIA